MNEAQAYAAKISKLPERLAIILGKTHRIRGDSFEIADDTALEMVWELLDDIDETLIERNKDKRLSHSTFKVRMR